MDSRLLLVTQSGNVDALYSHIKANPCILQNIDVVPFIHTPLHEASATGKIDLAMELMILMPSFAKKLNEDGSSPLHLAVENHKVELALELAKVDPSLVHVQGRGGVTPLHLVVKKGNDKLLIELLNICPGSIKDVNIKGQTVLHIAVIKERYKEIKVLRGWMQRLRQNHASSTETRVLNGRDREGNTALHLAAAKNDYLAVKQLLKCKPLNLNIQNNRGMTELDVLQTTGPHMTKATEELILKRGGKSAASLAKVKEISEILRTRMTFQKYCRTSLARFKNNMSDGTRNALLVITALIISATYQTAVQPEEKDPEIKPSHLLSKIVILWGFNSVAFCLSLVLTFLLLPVGRAYNWWYLSITLPLLISFGISVYLKYDVRSSGVLPYIVNVYMILLLLFVVYALVFYVKWKWTTHKKVPKRPTDKMISQGFKTDV